MMISTQVMTVWVLTLFMAYLAGRGREAQVNAET